MRPGCYWLVSLLLVTTQASAATFFDFFQPVEPRRPFQVMAHRGAMYQAPENTRPALEHVIDDAFEWAEIDVRLSADGQHVVWHDSEVDGKTDGAGALRELTLEQLQALDVGSWFAPRFAGERMLRLTEAFEIARDRLNLYLDCKDVDPGLLVREILDAGMTRHVLVYGAPDLAREIRQLSGGRVAVMLKWRPEFGLEDWIADHRPDAVELDAGDVTPETVKTFHASEIWVQAKVLGADDRPEVWERMVDAGVDWLQTDFPEEVLGHCLWKRMKHRPVRLAMHRGTVRYAPENTLSAYSKALRMGADYVEFDVRTTADGETVLLHDGTLDRTTSGTGPVAEATAALVAGLDAGAWFGRPYSGTAVPTFDAFLAAMAGEDVQLYLDAKDITPEALSAALVRHGLVARTVVYQSADYLARLRAVNPDIRRMPPLREREGMAEIVEQVAPYAFDVNWGILSEELIAACHRLGVRVYSDALWRNETVDAYLQAIAWGIDVIQTDHPVRVMRAVERWAREHRSAETDQN